MKLTQLDIKTNKEKSNGSCVLDSPSSSSLITSIPSSSITVSLDKISPNSSNRVKRKALKAYKEGKSSSLPHAGYVRAYIKDSITDIDKYILSLNSENIPFSTYGILSYFLEKEDFLEDEDLYQRAFKSAKTDKEQEGEKVKQFTLSPYATSYLEREFNSTRKRVPFSGQDILDKINKISDDAQTFILKNHILSKHIDGAQLDKENLKKRFLYRILTNLTEQSVIENNKQIGIDPKRKQSSIFTSRGSFLFMARPKKTFRPQFVPSKYYKYEYYNVAKKQFKANSTIYRHPILDKIINQIPAYPFYDIEKEFLLALLSNIHTRQRQIIHDKSLNGHEKNPFVSVPMSVLVKILDHSLVAQGFEILSRYGIIECSPEYEKGVHGFGYRITIPGTYKEDDWYAADSFVPSLYLKSTQQEITVSAPEEIQKIADNPKEIVSVSKTKPAPEHKKELTGLSSFFQGIIQDISLDESINKDKISEILNSHVTGEFRRSRGLYYFREIGLLREKPNLIYVKSDKNTGRVYTNLVNSPAYLRKYLRYKENQPLVEIDVRNCQPLLLYKLYTLEDRSTPEAAFYKQKTSKEDFYEFIKSEMLADEFLTDKQKLKIDRNYVKKSVFQFFFAKNYYESAQRVINIFIKYFPILLKRISSLKAANYKLLARFLQKSEAALIIGKCAPEFQKRNIPVITIHDAILTTKNHVDMVTKVIYDEFDKEGVAPILTMNDFINGKVQINI